jgi:hypothetical protein
VLLHDAGAWRGGGSAFASMARLIKRWDRQAGQQRENHPPPQDVQNSVMALFLACVGVALGVALWELGVVLNAPAGERGGRGGFSRRATWA